MTDPTAEGPTAEGPTVDQRARAAFAVIGRQARDSNLHRLDELEVLASHVTTAPLSEDQRRTGQQVAHTLLGSAGTFGFTAVTEPARRLEVLFAAEIGPQEAGAVGVLLDLIRTALMAGPSEDDD